MDGEESGGYLIPPGEPSAAQYCEALNREAEHGVYYVTQTAELPGWTYIQRLHARIGAMTDEAAQQPELAEIASKVGDCPDCGKPATRVAGRYPGKATVACDEGHQWEAEISES